MRIWGERWTGQERRYHDSVEPVKLTMVIMFCAKDENRLGQDDLDIYDLNSSTINSTPRSLLKRAP